MIEIRAARPEDGPGILEIVSRIDTFNSAEKACVEELWSEYLNKQSMSSYNFLVCHDGERVLGFACYGPHPLTESTHDLHWIAVCPDVQGRGVGRALLTSVEARVQMAGGTLLVIETSGRPEYQVTRHFYGVCGYHCQAIIHDFYAIGDDLVIFVKYLNGQPTAMHSVQQVA
ncbi:MAG: GNAT family N-acetyltransferase [Anaerolineae bacterium]